MPFDVKVTDKDGAEIVHTAARRVEVLEGAVTPPPVTEPPPTEPPPVEPPPTQGTLPPSWPTWAPFVNEQFAYPDTATMLASKSPVYYDGENNGWANIFLGARADGTGKEMEYRQPANPGGSTTISRKIENFSLQEAWAEAVVRFPTGFSIDAPSPPAPTGDAALKLFFLNVQGTPGRFGVGFSYGTAGEMDAGGPNDPKLGIRLPLSLKQLCNGKDTRVLYHAKLDTAQRIADMNEIWVSNPDVSGGAWIYGQGIGKSLVTAIVAATLGANQNKGPVKQQSYFWRSVKLWKR